jgi:hypothetical protein
VGLADFGYPQPMHVTEISLRSVRVDFPFFEWRFFRSFALNQSSGIAIQFTTGIANRCERGRAL